MVRDIIASTLGTECRNIIQGLTYMRPAIPSRNNITVTRDGAVEFKEWYQNQNTAHDKKYGTSEELTAFLAEKIVEKSWIGYFAAMRSPEPRFAADISLAEQHTYLLCRTKQSTFVVDPSTGVIEPYSPEYKIIAEAKGATPESLDDFLKAHKARDTTLRLEKGSYVPLGIQRNKDSLTMFYLHNPKDSESLLIAVQEERSEVNCFPMELVLSDIGLVTDTRIRDLINSLYVRLPPGLTNGAFGNN